VEVYALVDSGSEKNLFAPVLAEIIDIDFESGVQRPIVGIAEGQPRSYFEHELEMVVGDKVFKTSVGFMPDLSQQAGHGLVGQNGFFDHFNYVKFDKRGNNVELGYFLG
jgi:hypothetical protein